MIRRVFRYTLKGCLSLLLTLVAVIGFVVAVWWYNAREEVTYQWDHSIENQERRPLARYEKDGLHRGVSFMAHSVVNTETLRPLVQNNIEWIVLHPYAWQRTFDDPEVVRRPTTSMRWSASDSTIEAVTKQAHEAGLRIFLKPHIWLAHQNGKWRSDIEMKDEADWATWFAGYTEMILDYAGMAEELGIEMLCIGTELKTTALLREKEWRMLTASVREVYSGEITYAANWDEEYQHIAFWDALDYIGIQAYFPLTNEKNPQLRSIVSGWQVHKQEIEATSRRFDKPVLFTEIGYKSTVDATIEPWRWFGMLAGSFDRVSVQTQATAFEGFFEVFWNEPWFAGAYVWRWASRHDAAGGLWDRAFWIQNKSAQNVVAKGFSRAKQ